MLMGQMSVLDATEVNSCFNGPVAGLAFFREERYFFPSVGRNMGKKGRNTFLPGRNGRN